MKSARGGPVIWYEIFFVIDEPEYDCTHAPSSARLRLTFHTELQLFEAIKVFEQNLLFFGGGGCDGGLEDIS